MRLLRFFRPSHQHTAFSATLLLMTAIILSRVIGYLREAYIAYAFGAGQQTDAYVAAFTLPDWLNYIVAGGTASITFISIYTRFLAEKREQDAQKTFSIIITVMTAVLVRAQSWPKSSPRNSSPGFPRLHARADAALRSSHAHPAAGTDLLLRGRSRFRGPALAPSFPLPAFGPLIYNVFIIVGGVVGGRRFGIASLAYGALVGSIAGPFLINAMGAAKIGTGYRPRST